MCSWRKHHHQILPASEVKLLLAPVGYTANVICQDIFTDKMYSIASVKYKISYANDSLERLTTRNSLSITLAMVREHKHYD